MGQSEQTRQVRLNSHVSKDELDFHESCPCCPMVALDIFSDQRLPPSSRIAHAYLHGVRKVSIVSTRDCAIAKIERYESHWNRMSRRRWKDGIRGSTIAVPS